MHADPVRAFVQGLATDLGWVLPAVLCLIAVWCLALLGAGGFTGWRRLASRYPALPFAGRRILPGWVSLRRLTYRNLVVLRAGDSHLHVKLWLRLGHPPFSVPWEDIRAERVTVLGRKAVALKFAREPQVPMNVYGTIAERLAAASGGRLHIST